MRISPFLLLLCMFSPLCATAQDQSTKPTIERVIYTPAVPKDLRAFIPHDGKSRFWGQSDLSYNRRKVWVHVYNAKKMRLQKDVDPDGKQQSGLDLFVFDSLSRLKRVSSTRFSYYRNGGYNPAGDGETIGVRTFYLDAVQQKNPIVEVALQDPNGLYGTITQYAIFVFGQGLTKTPVLEQRFGKGESNAADWSAWDTKFITAGNGLTEIVFNQGSSAGGRKTFFRWEKNTWKSYRRTEQEDYSSPAKEVPFDTPLWGYENYQDEQK